VKYQPIADRLWEGVKAVLESEGALQSAIQSRVEYAVKQKEAIDVRLNELSRKQTNLKNEKDIVITGYRKGFYDDAQLQHQLSLIEEEEQNYIIAIEGLLADKRLQGDTQSVYEEGRRLIPIMQEKLNNTLGEKEKWEIIKLLVKQALLNRVGDLTIELTVPAPDSFISVTSPRAALPGCRLHPGDAGAPPSRWT